MQHLESESPTSNQHAFDFNQDKDSSPKTPPLPSNRSSPLVTRVPPFSGASQFQKTSLSIIGRQNSGSLSSVSATAAATADFSFDSPRIAFPPNLSSSYEGPWSPMERPQSAEKKRWLARANLLREGDSKVAKMAQEDDEASRLGFGHEKYIYLEYMDWMGEDIFQPKYSCAHRFCL